MLCPEVTAREQKSQGLSQGQGHNKPLFNLKAKILNLPTSHTQLKRKSVVFELYLGHLFA